MHTMKAVLPCLLVVAHLNTFAAEPSKAHVALDECSTYSQAGMRECLMKKVSHSNIALKQAEDKAHQVLSRWDEDAKYVKRAVATLNASGKEFVKYRDAHCAFEASLGGGAAGNSLEMKRLACALELNLGRAEQLNTATAGLPAK